MRVAVVGHVEWVTFVRVPALPARGSIAPAHAVWDDVGGGGGITAVQLARLGAEVHLFTALGSDEHADRCLVRLREEGVATVRAGRRTGPQRRAVAMIEDAAERTILLAGGPLRPVFSDDLGWDSLAGFDGCFLCSGDPGAVRAARGARVLVASGRAREALAPVGVTLDVLIASAADPGEHVVLDPRPRLDLRTEGEHGGAWRTADGASGRWAASPPPGPVRDAFGCGDSFVAGLTLALARGDDRDAALAFAARAGAEALTAQGPYT